MQTAPITSEQFDLIRETYAWYEKRRIRSGGRLKVNFKTLYTFFREGKPLAEGRRTLGVSKGFLSRVQKKFERLPGFVKWERKKKKLMRRAEWEARFAERRKLAEKVFLGRGPMRSIVLSAREYGWEVRAVPWCNRSTKFLRNRLIINGKLCSIHFVSSLHSAAPGALRRYGNGGVALSVLESVEAVILCTRCRGYVPRMFIVPSEIILNERRHGGSCDVSFAIPLEPLPSYNNRKTRIDWWRCEDAWGQLSREGAP